MTEKPNRFVAGGYIERPPVVDLPPIEKVMPGTVYQDPETGSLWKALNGGRREGKWLRAEAVTASEHATLKRKRLIYLIALLIVAVFSWVVIFGPIPLPPEPWNFLSMFALGGGVLGLLWAWFRSDIALATHIVAPSPGDV